MSATEGYPDVDGGRVWYRSVGEGRIPLLCLHGGPGFTHYYLEPLEAPGSRPAPNHLVGGAVSVFSRFVW